MDHNQRLLASWGKEFTSIAKMPDTEAMATDLTWIGKTKDKSAQLTASEGDSLEMVSSGGELEDFQQNEGKYEYTVRVLEPTDDLLTLLGLGNKNGEDFDVTSHVVGGFYSLQVEPQRVGGRGIRAPKCSITYIPGYSEEDGNYADLKFRILHNASGYWYRRFTKKAATTPAKAASAPTQEV